MYRPMNILAIGVFGAIGGILRFTLDTNIQMSSGFPLATLLINLIGSLVLGFFHFFAQARDFRNWIRSGICVGLIGGFTTFSTFSMDIVQLIHSKPAFAALYGGGTVIGGLVCVLIGEQSAKWIYGMSTGGVGASSIVKDVTEAEEAYL